MRTESKSCGMVTRLEMGVVLELRGKVGSPGILYIISKYQLSHSHFFLLESTTTKLLRVLLQEFCITFLVRIIFCTWTRPHSCRVCSVSTFLSQFIHLKCLDWLLLPPPGILGAVKFDKRKTSFSALKNTFTSRVTFASPTKMFFKSLLHTNWPSQVFMLPGKLN